MEQKASAPPATQRATFRNARRARRDGPDFLLPEWEFLKFSFWTEVRILFRISLATNRSQPFSMAVKNGYPKWLALVERNMD